MTALALVAVSLVFPAAGSARQGVDSHSHFVWQTGKYDAYRVRLPSTWRYRDASYPSDHGTYLWYDPTNPLRKLLITVSGCIGCVETDFDPHRPNPRGELPHYASNLYWISPWKLAFSGYATDDPYPANGLVIVLSRNGNVAGSTIAELWLPRAEHSVASKILNSLSTHA